MTIASLFMNATKDRFATKLGSKHFFKICADIGFHSSLRMEVIVSRYSYFTLPLKLKSVLLDLHFLVGRIRHS